MKRLLLLTMILSGLLSGTAASRAVEELPFVGTWDCEVATFSFTPEIYNNGSEDLDILEAQEGTDGSYTLFFADDYIITLSGFTSDSMGWFSPESGDNFSCKRVAG